jgi:hypothetical protein
MKVNKCIIPGCDTTVYRPKNVTWPELLCHSCWKLYTVDGVPPWLRALIIMERQENRREALRNKYECSLEDLTEDGFGGPLEVDQWGKDESKS